MIKSNLVVNKSLLEEFQSWEVPKCPINGRDLTETNLVPRGKVLGTCLNTLTAIWIDSDFKMDKDHLLKVELPKIAENMLNTPGR